MICQFHHTHAPPVIAFGYYLAHFFLFVSEANFVQETKSV